MPRTSAPTWTPARSSFNPRIERGRKEEGVKEEKMEDAVCRKIAGSWLG
jgi:hypothetical protein